MSRITKDIAKDVALKLVEPKQKKLEVLKNQQKEAITQLYLKSIPKEVMDFYEKFPEFVRIASETRITAPGIGQYEEYPLTLKLPRSGNRNNSYPYIELDGKDSAVIVKMDNAIEKLQKTIRDLRVKIENGLVNLRTYSNVQREFPEAFALLPATTVNTSLMVNISSIREELK